MQLISGLSLLQLHSGLHCDLTALTLVEIIVFIYTGTTNAFLDDTNQITKIRKPLSSEVYLVSKPNG